jgi:ferredoxin
MKIFFKESGISADLVAGKTILEYALELGVEINAPCNGEGKCGQCLVEVESAPGALSPRTEVERKVIADEVHRPVHR